MWGARSQLRLGTQSTSSSGFDGHPDGEYDTESSLQQTSRMWGHSYEWTYQLRVPELGYRLPLHDVPGACRSVLSFAMEPHDGEGEDEDEGERDGDEVGYWDEQMNGDTGGYLEQRDRQLGYTGEEHADLYEDQRALEYEGEGERDGDEAGYRDEQMDEDAGGYSEQRDRQFRYAREERAELYEGQRTLEYEGEFPYDDGRDYSGAGQGEGMGNSQYASEHQAELEYPRIGDYGGQNAGDYGPEFENRGESEDAGAYEYQGQREHGGAGQHWSRMEQHADEDEDGEEGEVGVARGRRQKARKARRPYTVTCALRKTNFFEASMQWEDEHFRSIYRVSKDTFWGMVDILKENEVFQTSGRKKQRPVHYQLGVFLMRYGISGSHARHPKLLTSIGEGTVFLYCRRVTWAIRHHGLQCVTWPTAERKEVVKAGFKRMCGLDGIIGSLDGTLCGLETKPRVAGDSYISRKKTLSVNVQATVDHTGRFTSFQSGWAGSRPDRAVWPDMRVYLEHRNLFAPGEFLLADGGYDLSPFVLIPFARNELGTGANGRRRRDFNYRISCARIVVEWAFGRLKARFPALKKLGAVNDMKQIYRAIEAMMVVHNMCYDLGDSPDGLRAHLDDDEVDAESDDDEVDAESDDDLDQEGDEYENVGQGMNSLNAGRAFRLRCMDIICPA